MRTYQYTWRIECVGPGRPDLGRVEHLLNLALQDLVYDDEFIAALDEQEAVSVELLPGTPSA